MRVTNFLSITHLHENVVCRSATSRDVEKLVIRAAERNRWITAISILDGAIKLDMIPTWRAYKAAIDSVANHTNWLTSVAVLDRLRGGRLSTHALFRNLLAASMTSNSSVHDSFHILCAAGERGVSITSKECALVAKKLEINRSNDILLKMPSFLGKHGIPLTCDIASSVLGACADNDGLLWREAALLYSATCSATNGNPSETATHAFIRSLDGSHWKLGLEGFVAASHSVRQRPKVISATASLLQRCGRWRDAFKIIGSLHALKDGYWDDDMDALVDRHSMEIPWIKSIQLLDRRPRKSHVSDAAVGLTLPKDQWEICTRMIESSILTPRDPRITSPHTQRHNAMIILHACQRLVSVSPWSTALRCIEVATASNLLSQQGAVEALSGLLRVKPIIEAVLDAAIVMKVPRTKELLTEISKMNLLERLAMIDGFSELSIVLSVTGMWNDALKVCMKAVEGRYDGSDKCRILAEELMVQKGLWVTALHYASICPLGDSNTLRTFSIPLCAVNGRWEVVHKGLTPLRDSLTDVEGLLQRESQRNLTERDITSAIKRNSLTAAYDCFVSYYDEIESSLLLSRKVPLPLGASILNQLCEMAFHECEMGKAKKLGMRIEISKSSDVALFVREVLCNHRKEDATLRDTISLMRGLFTSAGVPFLTSLTPLLSIPTHMRKFLGSPQAILSICRRILKSREIRIDVDVLKYALISSQAYLRRPFPDFVCNQIERAILRCVDNGISWAEALFFSNQSKLRTFSDSLFIHSECIIPLAISIPVSQWKLAINLLQSSKEETDDTIRCARDIIQASGNLSSALSLAEKIAFFSKEDAHAYVTICRAKTMDVEESKFENGVHYGSWVLSLRAITSITSVPSSEHEMRKYYEVMMDLMRVTSSKSWSVSLNLFCRLHKDSFKTPTNTINITPEDVYGLLDSIISAGRLLKAAQLLEMVISYSFQSKHRIVLREELFTKLIYACVPLNETTIPRSEIQQTLEIMRRVSKKSNQLRLMSSMVQLLHLEEFDDSFEPEVCVGNAVDMYDHVTLSEVSYLDIPEKHRWTNEEKANVASCFPLLQRDAPKEWFSTRYLQNNDPRMRVFVDVAAKLFKGRISGIDVHSLWYRNKGGSMRHLERLFLSKRSRKLLPNEQLSDMSEQTHSSLTSRPIAYHGLASKLPLIKYGSAQDVKTSIGNDRPVSMFKFETFKSWADIRKSVAKEVVAAADVTLEKMDDVERLLITLSDYADRDIEDPCTLAEISLNVFNGTAGAKAVHSYLKRNWDKIHAFRIERWPRAAEEEIETCFVETNQFCSSLRSLPIKTTQEIHSYALKFQCVILNRNSFSLTDLETIAVSATPTIATDSLISLHSKASITQTVYKHWRRIADLRCSSLRRCTNMAETVGNLRVLVCPATLRQNCHEKEPLSERHVMERAVRYQFRERGYLPANQCVNVIKIYGSDWVSAFNVIQSSGSLTWAEGMQTLKDLNCKSNVRPPVLFPNFQHLPLLRGYAVLCSEGTVDSWLSGSIRAEIERLISHSPSSAADAKVFWIHMVSSGITNHMLNDDVDAISRSFAAHCP